MLVGCLLAIHLRSLDQYQGKVNCRSPHLCLCHQRKRIPHRLYNIRVNRWCKCEIGEAQEFNPEVHHKKPFWIWKVPHLLWHTVVDSTDSLSSISNKDHLNCIYQNYSGEFFCRWNRVICKTNFFYKRSNGTNSVMLLTKTKLVDMYKARICQIIVNPFVNNIFEDLTPLDDQRYWMVVRAIRPIARFEKRNYFWHW